MVSTKSEPPAAAKKVADDEALQADVASFAASLGLGAGAGAGVGFDDVDFRKTGPVVPTQKKKKKQARQLSGESASLHSIDSHEVVQAYESRRRSSTSNSNSRLGNKDRKRASPFVKAPDEQKKMAKTGAASLQENFRAESGTAAFREPQLSNSIWYDAATAAAARVAWNDASAQARGLSDAANTAEWETLVQEKRREGEQLLEKVASDYAKFQDKDTDRRWVSRAGKVGTSADKVAAMTVMVQDNPIANLRALDSLLGMVTSKGGKRHAVTGILALKELFLTNLLPDRKLKYLSQQPLSSLPETKEGKKLLLFWLWEDSLKQRYEKFVAALEEFTKDSLPVLKEKAVKTVFELLRTKPEQERRLLAALVNKLGDPERKTASNASYMLSCLLSEHPNMKAVVVEEVDSFVFRPHVGLRARYYATVFLNQLVFSSKGDGPKLAKRLIDLYFALFRILTSEDTKPTAHMNKVKKPKSRNTKKDKNSGRAKEGAAHQGTPTEIDSRLLSSLLTGINRAFPFVAADEVDVVVQSHSPLLFRLVHSENLNVGVQALILLHQLLSKNLVMSDRFYRALYDVLQSHGLFKSSKVEMFIGLLFKAIKADINSKRVAAFVKRLMQVTMQQPPQYACGALLIVSDVLKARPSLWDAILQPESNDEEDEHFVDVVDGSEDCAGMSSLGRFEDSENKGAVQSAEDVVLPRDENDGSGSDAEEMKLTNYDDSDEDGYSTEDDSDGVRKQSKIGSQKFEKHERMSPLKSQAMRRDKESGNGRKGEPKLEAPSYNPRSREPAYCNADLACWWELSALSVHVHPSVAAMAKTLLAGANVVYSGDPLRDFALGVFLDRFAEKKPKVRKSKESGTWHGSSLSFPTRTVESSSSLPVGEQFLSIAQADVAPEDVVFHKFYLAKAASTNRSKKKQKKRIEDDDTVMLGSDDEASGADESDNDEVDTLLDLDEGDEDSADVFSAEGEDASSDGYYDYDNLEAAVARDDGRDARVGRESAAESSEENSASSEGSFENLEQDVTSSHDVLLVDEAPEQEQKPVKKRRAKRQSAKG